MEAKIGEKTVAIDALVEDLTNNFVDRFWEQL